MSKSKRLLVWLGILVAVATIWLADSGRRTEAIALIRGEPLYEGEPLSTYIGLLDNPNYWRRRHAVLVIGRMGPPASEAIPALVKVAKSDPPGLRGLALSEGLGKLGPAAVAPVREFLKDKNLHTTAICTLGEMGPDAAAAVPDLISLARDAKPSVRSCACVALGRIGPAARDALPVLQEAARDPDLYADAVAAMVRIDPSAGIPPRRPPMTGNIR